MARFRSTSRSFPTRRRANKAWAGFATTAAIAVAANTKVLLGSFALSNPNIDETFLRTVGVLSVQSDQVAASENWSGAFGIVGVTDLAIAAGAASIPGPITDRSDDGWFVYVPFLGTINVGDSTGIQSNILSLFPFDSKAKRKFDEGQQAALMVENSSASTGFNVQLIFRSLSMIS